jgi:hypothetical protein
MFSNNWNVYLPLTGMYKSTLFVYFLFHLVFKRHLIINFEITILKSEIRINIQMQQPIIKQNLDVWKPALKNRLKKEYVTETNRNLFWKKCISHLYRSNWLLFKT